MEKRAPNELEKRVDEVLYYVWDPIGVSESPYARSEYRPYVPTVLRRLTDGYSAAKIADYLCRIESESMGLSPNKERAIKAANILLEGKSAIEEGCA